MAKTNLGKVVITPKGEYDPSKTYCWLDVVRYNGSSYLARKTISGITPTDGENYILLVAKGDKGEKGDSFEIYKTYPTTYDMNYDFYNVPEGKFVLISSNVEDEDNAKLYVRAENSFNYVTDLSGATGIKGEKGDKGDKGDRGATGGTAEVVQTTGGSETAVMSQKAATDNFMHPAGFLYQVTEGLTDADAFPYNTGYYIMQAANVANIPLHTGMLWTFGSTNPNNGAFQMFVTYLGEVYTRIRYNKAWASWVRMAKHDNIQRIVDSNNTSTVGMHTGKLINSAQEAPLDDANTYPANTIYSFYFPDTSLVKNLPATSGTMMTFNYANNTTTCKCQLFVTRYGMMYSRINWASSWTAWKMCVTEDKMKTALQKFDSYVSLSMFEKFGVVGDSCSSGAIYVLNADGSQKSAGSYYNLSWGQIMARKLGTTCTNFSKGGLSTRTWLTDDKGLPLLLATEPQNIYYLMLGINDKGKHGVEYIGTIADIKTDYAQNADTFYGNYGKIISNIKEHAPNAKIIMSTMIGKTGANKSFNDAIEAIAAHFGIPCVKQYENDFFNSDFYRNNIVKDHPTAPVYSGMANALQKMFEDAVRDNVAYFNDYIG